MAMRYDLSSIEILKALGYSQVVGQEWLENLKREKQIALPQVYCDFMELVVDCPLFGVSDLFVGKMVPGVLMPQMFYDCMQHTVQSQAGQWSEQPDPLERSLHEIADIPMANWPDKFDNYLLIGSDYDGSMEVFGVRTKDLQEKDPPVYTQQVSKDTAVFDWTLKWGKLSEFLMDMLFKALMDVEAEQALTAKGWRCEEYYDEEEEDWVAPKAVLKRYGIDFSKLQKRKARSGEEIFCCYDEERNVFFVGDIDEGEINLYAFSRLEAEYVFPDLESLDYQFDQLRASLKKNDVEDLTTMEMLYLYLLAPKDSVMPEDHCYVCYPPKQDENGEIVCPTTLLGNEPLYRLCSGKTFVKVVRNTLQQNPNASNLELAEALNEYLHTDHSNEDLLQ